MPFIQKYAEPVAKTTDLSREEWLELRRAGIGGSDVAAIKGVSKYKSPFALWVDKVGGSNESDSSNEATQWGHDLELVVARRFAKTNECAVVAVPYILRSKRFGIMLANLDFVIVDENKYPEYPVGEVSNYEGAFENLPEVETILEIKTTGIASRGNPSAWENGEVPESYELQGQHYSIVTGVDGVIFAALVGGRGLVTAGRLYNSETKNAELVDLEAGFWRRVIEDDAPPVDGAESTSEALKSLYPESVPGVAVVVDDFVTTYLEQYRIAKKELDEVNRRVIELRNRLEAAIGSGESLIDETGRILATYKSTKPQAKINTTTLFDYLAKEFPGLLETFKEERPGYRVLRLGKDSE